jgi:hypothetical protein
MYEALMGLEGMRRHAVALAIAAQVDQFRAFSHEVSAVDTFQS